MNDYIKEELVEALKEVSSVINRCESMQGKFAEGTSQHTLLKNRIKAMYISKLLLENEVVKKQQFLSEQKEKGIQESQLKINNIMQYYTKEELEKALTPISSVISKCEKAQGKFAEGTTHYRRFEKLIRPMYIAKSLIADELAKIE